MRLSHFRTLWQFCYPKSKIIITGRPNFFLDDIDRKAALGIQEPSLERPYCEALHLSPFGIDKIEKSLRAADIKTREEIVQLAKNDDKFREIVSRPSLLYIVKTLWKDGELSQYKGRMNSALVMGMFIKQSLARQTAKVQDHRNFMVLNSSEREYFMLGIAAYMAKNELSNQITKQQLDEAVRLLLKVIPDSASTVDTMSGEKSTPLHQRLPKDDEEKALEYVKTDVRSCGLLVSDLSKSGAFKFAHKSFMEYLFASLIYNRLTISEKNKISEVTESIWNTFKIKRFYISHYPESVAFFAELLQNSIEKVFAKDKFVKATFDIIVLYHGHKKNSLKARLNKLLSYIGFYLKRLEGLDTRVIGFSFSSFGLVFLLNPILFLITICMVLILLGLILYLGKDSLYDIFKESMSKREGNVFELWYQCCKALKIEDKKIEKVVGKWAMPAFKSEQD
ncbi:MAG: hypothetical protein QM487_07035 [Candidatus Marithrix sp.]